jgi:hypothetical protein
MRHCQCSIQTEVNLPIAFKDSQKFLMANLNKDLIGFWERCFWLANARQVNSLDASLSMQYPPVRLCRIAPCSERAIGNETRPATYNLDYGSQLSDFGKQRNYGLHEKHDPSRDWIDSMASARNGELSVYHLWRPSAWDGFYSRAWPWLQRSN